MTPSQALSHAGENTNVSRLAPASVNMYQQAARSLFQWAADHDLIAQSPATILRDVKTGSAKDDRLPFTDEDLKAYFAVLEVERERRPWLYWIPRIMAFTGCRLGEAAQLRREDIRKEGAVLVMDINVNHPDKQLKTASSVRLVPLHARLLEMGFLDAIAAMPSGFLWPADMRLAPRPERSAVDKLQKLLATRLRASGVGHPKKTAAHRFRHTVCARLEAHSVPEYQIAELLGREHDSLTTNRYGAVTDLRRLQEALSFLSLPI